MGVKAVDNLFGRIEYYASYPLTSTIIVVWCDIELPLPRHSIIGNSLIYFVCPKVESLRYRKFKDVIYNDIRIATKAVLVISDFHGRKLLYDDISAMYRIFNKFPENIVSFVTRDLPNRGIISGLRVTLTATNAQYYQITLNQPGLDSINLEGVVMMNSVVLLNSTCGNYDVVRKIIYIGKK
jgi:hypothetical protein